MRLRRLKRKCYLKVLQVLLLLKLLPVDYLHGVVLVPIREQANLPELPISELFNQKQLIKRDRRLIPEFLRHGRQVPHLLLLGVGRVHHQRGGLDLNEYMTEFAPDYFFEGITGDEG